MDKRIILMAFALITLTASAPHSTWPAKRPATNLNGQATECTRYGVYGDEEDCTKFYFCNNGFVEAKSCGNGLRFHPQLKFCYFHEGDDCSLPDPPASIFYMRRRHRRHGPEL